MRTGRGETRQGFAPDAGLEPDPRPGSTADRDRPDAMSEASVPLVAVDANLLDRDGSARDALVERFERQVAAGRFRLFVPAGVAAEMRHPNAPSAVRARADDLLALNGPPSRPAAPTARQHIDRIRVRAILRGDGRAGKHDADAAHLSAAAEAGCDVFLTRDGKILRKRDTLRAALPDALRIRTLDELIASDGAVTPPEEP